MEDLEVPEDALREAIFNAIIHKDYTGVHIQMKVWDDRIDIWNDGGLPYDVSIEKNQGETREKIIELIRDNPYITQKEMRESLGLSQSGIEYQIRNLKKDCVIKRIGGDRGGHWEIL